MTHAYNDAMEMILQQLIRGGADQIRPVIEQLLNIAMRLEREQFLQAKPYERTQQRRGYANGYEPKRLDTPFGTLALEIPKTRNHGDTPFYPQSLERGRRVTRATMLCLAHMWVDGVSTRRTEKILAQFGLEKISATQVSRATKMLDEELNKWRKRQLGAIRFLILDARYEKVRIDGVVRDVAVLCAVGVDDQGIRVPLGVSVALSEAQVHWQEFLDSLVDRGMSGVQYVVSDNHSGLQAARKEVLPAALWQRCQFHLSQNALHHAPSQKIRAQLGSQLRAVWNSETREEAQAKLDRLVESYRSRAPELAQWLEDNIPEGFAVFELPPKLRRRMRTSNGIERPIQQEIKRRTQIIRVFPNTKSLLRLVTAILMEIEEKWITRRYIVWDDPWPTKQKHSGIYRDQVA